MMLFIALLAVGLIYVIKKGAFDWGERARREAEAEGRLLEQIEKKRQWNKDAQRHEVPVRILWDSRTSLLRRCRKY